MCRSFTPRIIPVSSSTHETSHPTWHESCLSQWPYKVSSNARPISLTSSPSYGWSTLISRSSPSATSWTSPPLISRAREDSRDALTYGFSICNLLTSPHLWRVAVTITRESLLHGTLTWNGGTTLWLIYAQFCWRVTVPDWGCVVYVGR